MPMERCVRVQFIKEFEAPGANRREVCRRYGIAPKTGYELLKRYKASGEAGLAPRSRRPHHSPDRLDAETESRILQIRAEMLWGARKIRWLMQKEGWPRVPARSTLAEVLLRNDQISEERSRKSRRYVRFEHERPNDLWQMDFKGHFALGTGERCHPLLVLDDHARYLLAIRACRSERRETVQPILVELFRSYGMPVRMLMDNGPPWGRAGKRVYSELEVWLIRLDVLVSHGRPRHPQTQGKVERLNRTLGDELPLHFRDFEAAEAAFGMYRPRSNEERPHESLDMQVPASRYRASERSYPESLPPVQYDEGVEVRRVQKGGWISYGGQEYRVGKAFTGQPVGLRPGAKEGNVQVYYCRQQVLELDVRARSVAAPEVVGVSPG